MRKFLIGLGILVVLLIAVVVALPFFIPVDWVKEQAENQARENTGRELSINGDVSLSIFPDVRIEANDVHFANEEGSAVEDMVSVKKLALDVELMPLLGNELIVSEFVLVEPVIYLEAKEDGSGNWEFEGQQADAGTGTGDSESGDGETTDSSSGDGLAQLRLGDVRIENGKVTLHDAATGETTEVSDINMVLSLPDLASPFNGEGSFMFKGGTLKLALGIESPQALMGTEASEAQVTLESGLANTQFTGSIKADGLVRGKVDLSLPSLSALMAWLEQPLDPSSPAPETIKVSGTLDLNGDTIAFSGGSYEIDDLKATGDVAVDMSGSRPAITANLVSEMLDLNPYLPKPEDEAASGGDSGKDGGDSGGSGGGDNTLAEPWSDEEIDFSGLDAANADLSFDLAGLRIQDIEIGRSRLHIVVNNGSATIDLMEAALYGGNGTALVNIDRSGGTPRVTKSLSVAGVEAQPLLTAAAGFDRLSGTADLVLDISTTGVSQRQFVNNLFGDGSFAFSDGSFRGANIGAMISDLSLDSLDSHVSGEDETHFSSLTGTYVIENGILQNDDLAMAAPLLRMTGEGNVKMPDKTLDYTIFPKAVASLEGQGGDHDGGVGIPINVRGPWADPQIAPDMEALAKDALTNPEAIGETLEQLQDLGVDDAGNLLEGLTGGSDNGGKSLLDSLGGDGDGGSALDSLFD